eukprot:2183141-Alexandrium_andersonii.AAC.1
MSGLGCQPAWQTLSRRPCAWGPAAAGSHPRCGRRLLGALMRRTVSAPARGSAEMQQRLRRWPLRGGWRTW